MEFKLVCIGFVSKSSCMSIELHGMQLLYFSVGPGAGPGIWSKTFWSRTISLGWFSRLWAGLCTTSDTRS